MGIAVPSSGTAGRILPARRLRAAGGPGRSRECGRPGVAGARAEALFNPKELVVLADALAPRRRARLDLAGARPGGEIRDRRVLGLPGPVRDDRVPTVVAGHSDRLQRLGQGAYLVELDQDGVAGRPGDPLGDPGRVRDVEVVPDQLDARSEPARERRPPIPVILSEPVFDGHDRKPADEIRVV